jgi:PKD repeat protein
MTDPYPYGNAALSEDNGTTWEQGSDIDMCFKTYGTYAPLEADADGPYAGIPGKTIQFTGSATGGVPPYAWQWEFGDGNTSTLQNPTHAYGEVGNYTVSLTVTDEENNTAHTTTTATITEPFGPKLKIESISGGLGVTVDIKNVGDTVAHTVDLNISIDGGLIIILPKKHYEILVLAPGAVQEIKIPVFGIGLGIVTPLPEIIITVTCAEGSSAVQPVPARIFGQTVILVH